MSRFLDFIDVGLSITLFLESCVAPRMFYFNFSSFFVCMVKQWVALVQNINFIMRKFNSSATFDVFRAHDILYSMVRSCKEYII